ncbi:MAG: hypothetical protein QOH71_4183, partial [Blastocatellia bacterium]|nr:hypothetical protein [Blastocatellia bacterium]
MQQLSVFQTAETGLDDRSDLVAIQISLEIMCDTFIKQ